MPRPPAQHQHQHQHQHQLQHQPLQPAALGRLSRQRIIPGRFLMAPRGGRYTTATMPPFPRKTLSRKKGNLSTVIEERRCQLEAFVRTAAVSQATRPLPLASPGRFLEKICDFCVGASASTAVPVPAHCQPPLRETKGPQDPSHERAKCNRSFSLGASGQTRPRFARRPREASTGRQPPCVSSRGSGGCLIAGAGAGARADADAGDAGAGAGAVSGAGAGAGAGRCCRVLARRTRF